MCDEELPIIDGGFVDTRRIQLADQESAVPAHQILEAGAKHMRDRAATYDKDGERSIPATVDAFNAVTGHSLTHEQGWLFMAFLKAVRSQQGEFKLDSYEDGAAYFALAGEQAIKDRPRGRSGSDCGIDGDI